MVRSFEYFRHDSPYDVPNGREGDVVPSEDDSGAQRPSDLDPGIDAPCEPKQIHDQPEDVIDNMTPGPGGDGTLKPEVLEASDGGDQAPDDKKVESAAPSLEDEQDPAPPNLALSAGGQGKPPDDTPPAPPQPLGNEPDDDKGDGEPQGENEAPGRKGWLDFFRGLAADIRQIRGKGDQPGPNTPEVVPDESDPDAAVRERYAHIAPELPCPDRLTVIVEDEPPDVAARVAELIVRQMRDDDLPTGVPPEVPHPERAEQLGAMRAALLDWARQPELELDLSERVSTITKVHFFDPADFKVIKAMYGRGEGDSLWLPGTGHIIIGEQDNAAQTLSLAAYWLTASISNQSIIVKADERGVLIPRIGDDGYIDAGGAFLAFDAGVTAITNTEVTRGWPAGLSEIKEAVEAANQSINAAELILVDGMIQAVAQIQETDPVTVLRGLQRGQIVGGTVALRNMIVALGISADEDRLARLKQLNSRPEMIQFADELGLRETRHRLQILQAGGSVQVLPYIDRGIKVRDRRRSE